MSALLLQGNARHIPLTDCSVDLIVTSPPYNAAATASAQGHPNSPRGHHWANQGYDGDDDALPEDEYQDQQVEALAEMARVLKPGASLCYVHKDRLDGGRMISPLQWLLRAPGELVLRQQVVLDFGRTWNHGGYYFAPRHDYVFWFTKGINHRHLGNAGPWGSVWRIERETEPSFSHPAPFSFAIPMRCIAALTQPGALVLDPYSGTCATGRAALMLGRRFVGIDKSWHYLRQSAVTFRVVDHPVSELGPLFESPISA